MCNLLANSKRFLYRISLITTSTTEKLRRGRVSEIGWVFTVAHLVGFIPLFLTEVGSLQKKSSRTVVQLSIFNIHQTLCTHHPTCHLKLAISIQDHNSLRDGLKSRREYGCGNRNNLRVLQGSVKLHLADCNFICRFHKGNFDL